MKAIYDMLGQGSVKPADTAEERSKNIFARYFCHMFFLSMFQCTTCFLLKDGWKQWRNTDRGRVSERMFARWWTFEDAGSKRVGLKHVGYL